MNAFKRVAQLIASLFGSKPYEPVAMNGKPLVKKPAPALKVVPSSNPVDNGQRRVAPTRRKPEPYNPPMADTYHPSMIESGPFVAPSPMVESIHEAVNVAESRSSFVSGGGTFDGGGSSGDWSSSSDSGSSGDSGGGSCGSSD